MTEFIKKEPVEKGWSADKKYRVTAPDGEVFLLRVSPLEKAERCEQGFLLQQKVFSLGVPMCRPVERGFCGEGFYILQSWVDGADAETLVPTLPEEKQYAYGFDAGEILKRIHTVPAPAEQPDWEERFNRKIDRKIKLHEECPISFEGAGALLRYVQENRRLLKGRPQCFQHGDYHIGNMMIDDNGRLTVIDFDRYDFGDPWEEYNRIVWCAQASPLFASGLLDGYFGGEVPEEFWRLLLLYIGSNTLSSLPWAIPFGEKEIETMLKQTRDLFSWYDGYERIVPRWYVPGGGRKTQPEIEKYQ